MTIANYTVTGMTCGGCAGRVRTAVGKLDGVTDIAVDVPTGRITVTSTAPIADSAVLAAVDEAGYSGTPTQS